MRTLSRSAMRGIAITDTGVVYGADVGLELRVSYDNELLSTTPVVDIEEGGARAARLKGIVLEKGGFEELAG
jgi:hypothetical protein